MLLGGTRAWDEHVGAFEVAGTVSGRREVPESGIRGAEGYEKGKGIITRWHLGAKRSGRIPEGKLNNENVLSITEGRGNYRSKGRPGLVPPGHRLQTLRTKGGGHGKESIVHRDQ